MSTWGLIQFVADIFMVAGIFVIIMRLNRAPKDDPRLSRGLQLLQSKISVLEDLSDRTETQVGQLTAILENKAREVQAKVQLAEQHVHEIRVSMERSLEVAKIFQDKIPHKEIIERQNTIKYVTAARLAHKGASIDEICGQVDLPRGEIEFIASVNRDRLMFTEEQLPEWVKGDVSPSTPEFSASSSSMSNFSFQETPSDEPAESREDQSTRLRVEMELAEQQRLVDNLSRLQFEMQNLDMQLVRENAGRDLSSAFDVPKVETDSLKRLGEEFRKAVETSEISDARQPFPSLEQLTALIPQAFEAAEPMMKRAAASIAQQMAPYPQGNAPRSESPYMIVPPTAQSSYTAGVDAQVASETAASDARAASIARTAAAHASAQSFAADDSASLQSANVATPSVNPAEKVRAALRKGVPVGQSSKPKPAVDPDLAAARALAKESSVKQTQPTHIVGGKPAKAGAAEPVIRRVMFPRIDDPQT